MSTLVQLPRYGVPRPLRCLPSQRLLCIVKCRMRLISNSSSSHRRKSKHRVLDITLNQCLSWGILRGWSLANITMQDAVLQLSQMISGPHLGPFLRMNCMLSSTRSPRRSAGRRERSTFSSFSFFLSLGFPLIRVPLVFIIRCSTGDGRWATAPRLPSILICTVLGAHLGPRCHAYRRLMPPIR